MVFQAYRLEFIKEKVIVLECMKMHCLLESTDFVLSFAINKHGGLRLSQSQERSTGTRAWLHRPRTLPE